MASNIYFSVVDCITRPLTGSRVVVRPYAPLPYVSGSIIAYGGPLVGYTDSNGYIQFSNLFSGIYRVSISNSNAILYGRNSLTEFANTVFYISVPDNSGSLVNGLLYRTGSVPPP